MDKQKLTFVTQNAEYAFWKTISEHYPEIRSGDVDPWTAVQFTLRLEKEVEQWYNNNAERD